MNGALAVWVLIFTINGQSTDYTEFKTNAQCEEHRKMVHRALRQAESTGQVFCEFRVKTPPNTIK